MHRWKMYHWPKPHITTTTSRNNILRPHRHSSCQIFSPGQGTFWSWPLRKPHPHLLSWFKQPGRIAQQSSARFPGALYKRTYTAYGLVGLASLTNCLGYAAALIHFHCYSWFIAISHPGIPSYKYRHSFIHLNTDGLRDLFPSLGFDEPHSSEHSGVRPGCTLAHTSVECMPGPGILESLVSVRSGSVTSVKRFFKIVLICTPLSQLW